MEQAEHEQRDGDEDEQQTSDYHGSPPPQNGFSRWDCNRPLPSAPERPPPYEPARPAVARPPEPPTDRLLSARVISASSPCPRPSRSRSWLSRYALSRVRYSRSNCLSSSMCFCSAVRLASSPLTASWWRCRASRSSASALARASRVTSSALDRASASSLSASRRASLTWSSAVRWAIISTRRACCSPSAPDAGAPPTWP